MEPRWTAPQSRFGRHVGRDEGGRLYDRRTRDQLRRVHATDADEVIDAVETVRAVIITAKAIQYSGERWAECYGLSQIRLELLMLVRHDPRETLTLGQVARALDLSPRTVTGLVDLLERDRLVTRTSHPSDRRATCVQLTAAGRDLVDQAWDDVLARHEPMFDFFTEDEVALLRHLCYKLLLNIAPGD